MVRSGPVQLKGLCQFFPHRLEVTLRRKRSNKNVVGVSYHLEGYVVGRWSSLELSNLCEIDVALVDFRCVRAKSLIIVT